MAKNWLESSAGELEQIAENLERTAQERQLCVEQVVKLAEALGS